jgi:hypothetical protein
MVKAKMIAKIRQRTLLALVVPVSGAAAAIGWATAPGRCREALGRAMVRTSFIIFVDAKRSFWGGAGEHYRRLIDNRLIKT